ncbi:uncharacterized protein LOC122531867 isoform X1 [Frieseomelitta varia]|uniref:uncharacterized protein LOC122531867 isoform X1 n=1 Tax=Frieseomelitta varia TaxID=561572 RepID=UPI001CB67FF2|nr:uncharacterized protein LOC122531867 isoform X1 [Frieseomelitta varia]
MYRRILVLIATLAFVLADRTDKNLRCYMCVSTKNPGCEIDPQAHNIQLVECTLNSMLDWKHNIQQHTMLRSIAPIFDVDDSQHHLSVVPMMACAKMIMRVANNQSVTVRNCQVAKTENIDPCKTMEGMLAANNYKLEFCELCTEDACNSSIAISPKIFLTLLSVLGVLVLGYSYNNA